MELDSNPLAVYVLSTFILLPTQFLGIFEPPFPLSAICPSTKKTSPPACVRTKGPSKKDVRGQGEVGSAKNGRSKSTYVVTVKS